jgi:hypothetical protein
MSTVHHPADSDPLPPPGTTPYFRRQALSVAVGLELARRGLPPDPWPL